MLDNELIMIFAGELNTAAHSLLKCLETQWLSQKDLQPWSEVERKFMLKNSSAQVSRQGSTVLHDVRTIGEGANVKLAEGLQRFCTAKDLQAGKAVFCKVYRGDLFDDKLAAKRASLKVCGKKVSLTLALLHHICVPATFDSFFMPPSHAAVQALWGNLRSDVFLI